MSVEPKNLSDAELSKINSQLLRMNQAIGSNNLSGVTVSSDAGKSALAALLSESMSENYRPEVARETVKKLLGLTKG